MCKVLAIPDIHFPAHHLDVFKFLLFIKKTFKPDKIVCLGDEIDAAGLGDWNQDPDVASPGDEINEAVKYLQILYSIFPLVSVCTSNHTARIYRKAFKSGIPKNLIKSYTEILKAPTGWIWADSFTIDDVVYEHGEGFSGQLGALKAAQANMACTVIGHLHSHAGIQYWNNSKTLLWGFNAGCLIDKNNAAFNYAKNIKSKPILGVGLIESGIPRFIPMILDKNGRWNGS